MTRLERLRERYARGELSLEDFEANVAQLLAEERDGEPDSTANRVEADRQGRRETLATLADRVEAGGDAEHCPRPEACVIAHPCRACGADRGEACTPRNPHAVALRDAAPVVLPERGLEVYDIRSRIDRVREEVATAEAEAAHRREVVLGVLLAVVPIVVSLVAAWLMLHGHLAR